MGRLASLFALNASRDDQIDEIDQIDQIDETDQRNTELPLPGTKAPFCLAPRLLSLITPWIKGMSASETVCLRMVMGNMMSIYQKKNGDASKKCRGLKNIFQGSFDGLVKSPIEPINVIPVKTGIQWIQIVPDSCFRRSGGFLTFYECISFRFINFSDGMASDCHFVGWNEKGWVENVLKITDKEILNYLNKWVTDLQMDVPHPPRPIPHVPHISLYCTQHICPFFL